MCVCVCVYSHLLLGAQKLFVADLLHGVHPKHFVSHLCVILSRLRRRPRPRRVVRL